MFSRSAWGTERRSSKNKKAAQFEGGLACASFPHPRPAPVFACQCLSPCLSRSFVSVSNPPTSFLSVLLLSLSLPDLIDTDDIGWRLHGPGSRPAPCCPLYDATLWSTQDTNKHPTRLGVEAVPLRTAGWVDWPCYQDGFSRDPFEPLLCSAKSFDVSASRRKSPTWPLRFSNPLTVAAGNKQMSDGKRDFLFLNDAAVGHRLAHKIAETSKEAELNRISLSPCRKETVHGQKWRELAWEGKSTT